MANCKTNGNRVTFLRERDALSVQEAFLSRHHAVPHSRLRRLGTPSVFDYLLAFDPTQKGIYLQTVVRWFSNGAIRLEDGRRTRTVLERFHADKRLLDLSSRDINRYASPGDIEAAFRAAAGESDIPLTLSVPAEVLAQAPMMASGEDWGIFSIEGPTAATWWGDSTSWCTRHPATFTHYLQKGPIYVIEHRGIRAQAAPGWNQLMDIFDRPLTMQGLTDFPSEAVERLKEILLSTMAGGGNGYTVHPADFYLRLLTGGKPGSLVVFKDGTAVWLLVPYKNRLKAYPLEGGLTAASIDAALAGEDFIDLDDMDSDNVTRRLETRSMMSILLQCSGPGSEPAIAPDGYEFREIDKNIPDLTGGRSRGKRWMVLRDGKPTSVIEQRDGINHLAIDVPSFSLQDISWLSDMDMPVADTISGTRKSMPKGQMTELLRRLFEVIRPDNCVVLEYGRVVLTEEAVDRWFRREPPDAKGIESIVFDYLDGIHGEMKSNWVINDILDMVVRDAWHAEEICISKRGRERNWQKRAMVLLKARRPPLPVRLLLAANRIGSRVIAGLPATHSRARSLVASLRTRLQQSAHFRH